MVGPLLLVKMLHCRQLRKAKKNSNSSSRDEGSDGKPRRGRSSNEISLKVEQSDGQSLCRACLKEGDIPIYGNAYFDDISEDLTTIAGIEVKNDDEYPKYLCQSCHSTLQAAASFRKTAQQSDSYLKGADDISFNNDSSFDDISNDTQVKHEVVADEEIDTDDFGDILYQYDIKPKYKKRAVKETGYRCKKCDKDFKTREEYTEHRLSIEHETLKVACPVCGNMYDTRYLKRHLLYHKMEPEYMCDICGKKFVIHGQFNRHRATHFIDKLPFQCSLCPYKGRYSESLKMHMRSHTGEKPYQCPNCPTRFFVNKSNLNKHMLTHKTEHNFKCGQCQRGFYSQRELDSHYKVDHSGIKEHICNICGKAFGYRKQMMKHQLKVHKRDKLRSGRTPLYLLRETRRQAALQQNAEEMVE